MLDILFVSTRPEVCDCELIEPCLLMSAEACFSQVHSRGDDHPFADTDRSALTGVLKRPADAVLVLLSGRPEAPLHGFY